MSDIAIVGIGCRFAGGIESPETFWDFVVDKRDAIVDIPATRWDYRRYYDEDKRAPGRGYTKRAAFMSHDPWEFDPEFFGISAREAQGLDPQQRLLLEVAWESLDDAGMAGRANGRSVGAFVGGFVVDQAVVAVAGPALAHVDAHSAASASYTMLSNRIAYALNLTGPAVTVDTACSSSLVAFHLACQALGTGDCEVALAGGVNVMLQPETFVMMCKGGFLAADGRSKSFDAAGDGYGRGEGAGIVVLKKLDDAVRDGDRVYAVVKATGTNQDGRTTAITVPNGEAQEALARIVCERAGVTPDQINYVEAHGTGTLVGDPIELRALGHVYGAGSGRAGVLGVGSLKATLGHTEAASGIAGVIKSALAIRHRTIPPQGWFERPNPDIPFGELGMRVQLDAESVDPAVSRMTVAVNSFGYGGTNAHTILQEFVPAPAAEREPVRHLGVLPISARTAAATRAMAGRFAHLLAAGAEPDLLAEAAWTRRAHHQYRTGVLVGAPAELIEELERFAAGEGRDATHVVARHSVRPVFVFSGMGPQWWGMARGLLTTEGAFADTARRIDVLFEDLAGRSVIEELLRSEDRSRIGATELAQPANFLVQVALVSALADLGIRPGAVVGHSVGEIAAGYVAGVLSLPDAVRITWHRARLQATTAGTGGMLAAGLALEQIREMIERDGQIDIAAVNSARAVTLSGRAHRLDAIAEKLTEQGAFARRLQVEVPYHSRFMDPLLAELRTVLADVSPMAPTLPLYSSVTGGLVTDAVWDAEYWCANVRQPVLFADAVTALIETGDRVFLEVGPHPVLSGNIRESLLDAGAVGAAVATLDRRQVDSVSLRKAVVGLYSAGALDPDVLFPPGRPATPHRPLPRYPWQRTRLRLDLPFFEQMRSGTPDSYAMLGDPDPDSDAATRWRVQLSTEMLPWLADHVVDGTRVLPGAAYLDAALSAAASRTGRKRVAVEQVRFVAPLIMTAPDVPLMELSVDESSGRFLIRSRTATGSIWTVNAVGRLLAGTYEPSKVAVPEAEIEIDSASFYAGLAARGLKYGPAFRRVTSVRAGATTVVALVDGEIARDSGHSIHPAVVDAAMQTVALLVADAGAGAGVLVPTGVDSVRLYGSLPDQITVVARRDPATPLRADVDLLDAEQNLCLRMAGVRVGALHPGLSPLQRMSEFCYSDTMVERPLVDLRALPDSGTTATVVVALGTDVRAARLAAAIPHARLCAVDIAVPEPEITLEPTLLDAVRTPEASRLHVCVVAGASVDDLAVLWALKRIALVVGGFVETATSSRDLTLPGGDADWCFVTLVTERAFVLPESAVGPDAGHAALAGARRVLLSEQSRLRWRLIDVEPETAVADLVAELAVPGAFSGDNTDEVLLRDGKRWVPTVTKPLPARIEALDTAQPLTDAEADFALELPKSRLLSALAWRRCDRRDPGSGEVEVRMRVIGLNYKDPLKVMGILGERELAGTYFGSAPGMEGVGTVTRLGADVIDLAVGDVVAVAVENMMRRYNVVGQHAVIRLPSDIDPGLCTSTTSFATAEYALLDLAQLRPGETVLIHGAAGGVGSAAIQVATTRGARVIGTASTDERRAHVLALGAYRAFNSRSLNFAEDVLAATDGAGVDVVLSTAPSEVLRQNFKAVTEFGRIVEVGKADVYTGGLLDLANFDKNLSYFSVDLDRMFAARPTKLLELLRRIYEKIDGGIYRALPYRCYGTHQVAEAFDEVVQSRLLGRTAISLDGAAPPVRPRLPEVRIDGTATYLITGGFGGFGLATGRWLVHKGARRLVLIGRSGANNEAARRQLAIWRAGGVAVVEELADIADPQAVTAIISRAHCAEHPMRGIFHAAGSVADNRLPAMDFDQVAQVYRPKVHGAKALHRAVTEAGIRPDMFVLYSSGGSMFGLVGQYNYTAANVAVEALAEQWARAGVPILCVGWGHMSGASGGMAADEQTQKYLELAGFDPIDMADGTAYLEQALRLGTTRAAIIPIDWTKLAGAFPHLNRVDRFVVLAAAANEDKSTATRMKAELSALDEGRRGQVVARLLADQLAVVMGVSADTIDLTVPVPELGLDSLMALEFAARVRKSLGIELMASQLGRSFSLEQAGPKVAELILAVAD
ncbi:type I polyketide synthase [Nocardia brasiliensis]|uniref:type I polyketide synthase n=1 Tax=Nocardia brasiliensis TaxID=37326 RepID=UPI003D9393ED